MPLTKVCILPGAGHHPTGYERGVVIDSIAEVDAIDIIVRTLQETLEDHMLHTEVLPTRKKPGLSKLERETVEPCSITIELGLSWFTRHRSCNESEVYYGPGTQRVAELICEALSEWGRCAHFGHRTQNPREIDPPGLVRVRLFALNGPDAGVYLGRLSEAGKDLGGAIAQALGK